MTAAKQDRIAVESGAERSIRPLVSVIVPCRNEACWIAGCLQSIFDNDYPIDHLEILVVDGQSNDGTPERRQLDGRSQSPRPADLQ